MAATPQYTHVSAFSSRTITVTSSEDLSDAIRTLSEGDGGTVLVDGSAGIFELVALNLGQDGAPVLIKPLDDDIQPHFEQANILNSSHLTITGMSFNSDHIADTRPAWEYDINVSRSNDITIVGNDMTSRADGFLDDSGTITVGERAVILRDSENLTFSHNTIKDYNVGIAYLEVKGLTIEGNDVSGIQSDGMRGGGIQDAVISGNYMHDFHGSLQSINHSDMIQIWGRGDGMTTKNLVISGNVLDASNGAATQSILVLNEEFDGTDYYTNVKIYDNVIHNGMQQGIGVNHVMGLEVFNNSLIWNEDAHTITQAGNDPVSYFPRMIIRDSPDAQVFNNISGESVVNEVVLKAENITLSYTNPADENYVGHHFVNLSGQGDLSLRDIGFTDDSPLKYEYGATLTSNPFLNSGDVARDTAASPNEAVIRLINLEGSRDGIRLSADMSLIENGAVTDSDITVRWVFADGTVQEGVEVTHVFKVFGQHNVTLEILRDGQELSSLRRKFEAESPELFDLDFNNNAVDITEHKSELEIRDANANSFTTARDGTGFHINADDKILIDRSNAQFTQLETFELNIGLKRDAGDSDGILAVLHRVFELRVDDTGKITFSLTTDDGKFSVTSDASVLGTTDWHDVTISYDGPAGTLQIDVDNTVVANGSATGMTTGDTGYDLVLGSLFSGSAKAVVDHFSLSTPTSSIYDVQPATTNDVAQSTDEVEESVTDTPPLMSATSDSADLQDNPTFLDEMVFLPTPTITVNTVVDTVAVSASDLNSGITPDVAPPADFGTFAELTTPTFADFGTVGDWLAA